MAPARFIARLFSPWRSGSSASDEAPHLVLGRSGERIAARYLRRQGYKVLYRNYRPPNGGEIDLVCRDRKTLVFVEVKTRAAGGAGRPADAIDAEKTDALLRGGRTWLRLLGEPDVPVRMDVVEVIIGEGRPAVTLTRDAMSFQHEDR